MDILQLTGLLLMDIYHVLGLLLLQCFSKHPLLSAVMHDNVCLEESDRPGHGHRTNYFLDSSGQITLSSIICRRIIQVFHPYGCYG